MVYLLCHLLRDKTDEIKVSTMMEWEWACWILLHLMVSGSCTLVTVHQPAVLTTALGHDVIMLCHLNLSSDERPVTPPVLYWHYVADNAKVWTPTERYAGRVDLVDQDLNSPNKSILLKNVQWVDSGKYLCKVSVSLNHYRFRTIGNETLLVVYDAIIFDLGRHNDSQLLCEVKVSTDPGFVLSIFHNGDKLQTADGAAGEYDARQPYVTLSKSVPLRGEGQYECQLHLNEDLVTNSTFSYLPSGNNPPLDLIQFPGMHITHSHEKHIRKSLSVLTFAVRLDDSGKTHVNVRLKCITAGT